MRGAKLISICNVLGSAATRMSDGVIYTNAGPEIGVASTKAFTTQLTALFLLTLTLAKQRGRLDAAQRHLPPTAPLEREWLRHDTDGQGAELAADLRDDRRASCAGSAALAEPDDVEWAGVVTPEPVELEAPEEPEPTGPTPGT